MNAKQQLFSAPPSQTPASKKSPWGSHLTASFHNLYVGSWCSQLLLNPDTYTPWEPLQPHRIPLGAAGSTKLCPAAAGGCVGLRPCSTAAEPALSMCCCSLSFCTSRHNPGQQKMKVEGSAECWAGGKRALFLTIPAICLNKPKKIFPGGISPWAPAADNCSCSPCSMD